MLHACAFGSSECLQPIAELFVVQSPAEATVKPFGDFSFPEEDYGGNGFQRVLCPQWILIFINLNSYEGRGS